MGGSARFFGAELKKWSGPPSGPPNSCGFEDAFDLSWGLNKWEVYDRSVSSNERR